MIVHSLRIELISMIFPDVLDVILDLRNVKRFRIVGLEIEFIIHQKSQETFNLWSMTVLTLSLKQFYMVWSLLLGTWRYFDLFGYPKRPKGSFTPYLCMQWILIALRVLSWGNCFQSQNVESCQIYCKRARIGTHLRT